MTLSACSPVLLMSAAPMGYQNGFQDYAAGWCPGLIYKDPAGLVHMHGLLTNATTVGAATTIVTLPPGFRPIYNHLHTHYNYNLADSRIDIYTTGQVLAQFASPVAFFSFELPPFLAGIV